MCKLFSIIHVRFIFTLKYSFIIIILSFLFQHQLYAQTILAQVAEHFVANLEDFDVFADGFHYARHVGPQNLDGRSERPGNAGEDRCRADHAPIPFVNRRRVDFHQDFVVLEPAREILRP